MIVKKIFLLGIFLSLVACELDNQSISAIVEIEDPLKEFKKEI